MISPMINCQESDNSMNHNQLCLKTYVEDQVKVMDEADDSDQHMNDVMPSNLEDSDQEDEVEEDDNDVRSDADDDSAEEVSNQSARKGLLLLLSLQKMFKTVKSSKSKLLCQ